MTGTKRRAMTVSVIRISMNVKPFWSENIVLKLQRFFRSIHKARARDQRFIGVESDRITPLPQREKDGVAFLINAVLQALPGAQLVQRMRDTRFGQITRLGFVEDRVNGEIHGGGKL